MKKLVTQTYSLVLVRHTQLRIYGPKVAVKTPGHSKHAHLSRLVLRQVFARALTDYRSPCLMHRAREFWGLSLSC